MSRISDNARAVVSAAASSLAFTFSTSFTRLVSPMATMGIAGRSRATTRQYVHLAGVFRNEAALLEQRMHGARFG
ncbi:MAG: hypothetical protein ACRDO9_11150 [Gaiellales bacterium]